MTYPVTPDGRYFVVRGRLWRRSNPNLTTERRAELTRALMNARRDKGCAMREGDAKGREAARQRVDEAKKALGERGAVISRTSRRRFCRATVRVVGPST